MTSVSLKLFLPDTEPVEISVNEENPLSDVVRTLIGSNVQNRGRLSWFILLQDGTEVPMDLSRTIRHYPTAVAFKASNRRISVSSPVINSHNSRVRMTVLAFPKVVLDEDAPHLPQTISSRRPSMVFMEKNDEETREEPIQTFRATNDNRFSTELYSETSESPIIIQVPSILSPNHESQSLTNIMHRLSISDIRDTSSSDANLTAVVIESHEKTIEKLDDIIRPIENSSPTFDKKPLESVTTQATPLSVTTALFEPTKQPEFLTQSSTSSMPDSAKGPQPPKLQKNLFTKKSSMSNLLSPVDDKPIPLSIILPNNNKISLDCRPEKELEAILKDVCEENGLNFDDYTFASAADKKRPIVLDKTAEESSKKIIPFELTLIKADKVFGVMCISENDHDVLILKANEGKLEVMAGTPDKLIERITDVEDEDLTYLDTLLLTFRSFMTPMEFFDQLVARFDCVLPEEPSATDIAFYRKMKEPTERRVIDALIFWASNHWHDFGLNTVMRQDLELFALRLQDDTEAGYQKEGNQLMILIRKQTRIFEKILKSQKAVEKKGKTMESMFENSTHLILSQQLCLHDFRLFKNIHPIEFLNQIWDIKKVDEESSTPALDFFIQRFDVESYWIATEILQITDLKKRILALKKVIKTARECKRYCNFFSTFAIFAGLNLSPIRRLTKTWEGLSDKTKREYAEIEAIMDPSRNMKKFRDLLLTVDPPMVCFLPIYLKDLTFMNDGNPSKLNNLINVEKLRMMATCVRKISDLGEVEYGSFTLNPEYQNYLERLPIERDMAKLKARSLELEP